MLEQPQRINKQIESLKDRQSIRYYKPEFLGQGAEQMVFSLSGHPDSVIKVNTSFLKKVLTEVDGDVSQIKEQLGDRIAAYVQKDRKRSRLLKDYFGDDYLMEKAYAMPVPVKKSLLEEAFTAESPLLQSFPEGTQDIWSLVRIQQRAPKEAFSEKHETMSFHYIESSNISKEDYVNLNQALVDRLGVLDMRLVAANYARGGSDLAGAIVSNPTLKQAVANFVDRAIDYTTETGEVLDIAGRDNVIFYPKDDEWKTLLMDAKYPREEMVPLVKDAIKRIRSGEDFRSWRYNVLANVLNYIRTINTFSLLSGAKKELRLFEEPIGEETGGWLQKMHQAVKKTNKEG